MFEFSIWLSWPYLSGWSLSLASRVPFICGISYLVDDCLLNEILQGRDLFVEWTCIVLTNAFQSYGIWLWFIYSLVFIMINDSNKISMLHFSSILIQLQIICIHVALPVLGVGLNAEHYYMLSLPCNLFQLFWVLWLESVK